VAEQDEHGAERGTGHEGEDELPSRYVELARRSGAAMSATATSATARPSHASALGRSPDATPHAIGAAPAPTAVIGAMALIRPRASPR